MRQFLNIISIVMICGAVVGVLDSLSAHDRATTIMQQIHAYVGIFGSITVISISLMSIAICIRLDKIIDNSKPVEAPASTLGTPESTVQSQSQVDPKKSPVW